MARKVSFNAVDITTAKYGNLWFFHRAQVAKALGYKSGINYYGDSELLYIGNETYLPFSALQDTLASATGERKTFAAGLMQCISEQLSIPLALNKPGSMIDDLPGTSASWAKAAVELKAASQLLAETKKKEQELWSKMEEERNNGN